MRGNLANKNGQAYQFTQGNRLDAAVGLEGYRYDGLGRRVLAWSPTLGNILSLYDRAGRLAYQQDLRRNVQVEQVYLGPRRVARREQVIGTGATTLSYQHTDALGSAAAATDASRMVTQRSEYEPYGDLLNRGNDDRPGYTGHVMDAETGLTYMQQRYYDPGIGMFLSVDPVTAYGNPVGQFHRYRYASNNPYKYKDPDGRFGVPGFLIGAGIEIVEQMATGEGSFTERLSSIDKTDVFVAGAVGAVTGGLGGRLGTQAAKGAISTGRAALQTAKAGGAASAIGSGASDVANGQAPDAGKMVASGTVGFVAAGTGSQVGLSGVAKLDRMAASSAPGAPNMAAATQSALRTGEVTTTAGQGVAEVGVNAAAAGADKVIEDRMGNRP